MTIKIERKTFTDFKTYTTTLENYADGIVLLGCGGSLEEWIAGVSDILKDAEIVESADPEILFTDFVELNTSGGRTDLALLFNHKTFFNMGKMVMWRIGFGDCCWASDYFDNYANQHNTLAENEYEDDQDYEDECESDQE